MLRSKTGKFQSKKSFVKQFKAQESKRNISVSHPVDEPITCTEDHNYVHANTYPVFSDSDLELGASCTIDPSLNDDWKTGRRVVELQALAQQMFCTSCDARLHLTDIESERRYGLGSILFIRCQNSVCSSLNDVKTGKRNNGTFDINSKLALDTKTFKKSLQEVHQFIANQRDNLNKQNKCGGVIHDCGDLKGTGCTSGIYVLTPNDTAQSRVYCNMNDKGWTVIQRRQDGSTNFYRGWDDYKNGFGEPTGEFWLGNEYIYKLTSDGGYQLRITLEDWNGDTRYATYTTFSLGNEASGYKLTIGGYSGTAGDSMSYSNGRLFKTKDRDDHHKCAQLLVGAWWYGHCSHANLNGEYLRGKTSSDKHPTRGFIWYHWKGFYYSLKKSEMMIRKQ
ncbi:fibrinogen-like protein 1 [Mytilus edulis]|uniref:fibrinogen-like protein 1 n=1 Tax=Mytilus edulis TaxID=6550 RepID=UPI0039F0D670